MDTLIIGQVDAVKAEEMNGILKRLLPKIHECDEKAIPLRKRVVDGGTQIARLRAMKQQGIPTDVNDAELMDADARLNALKEELRELDGWSVIGLSLALAEGVGALLADAGKQEGWRPPPGSTLRLVMPGLLNLSLDLHDQNYPKANP